MRFCIGLQCFVLVTVMVSAPAIAEEVVLSGKFGQVLSSTTASPEMPKSIKLEQKVRVDQLTSANPDWNGAELILYEHSVSFPAYGTYKIYGVLESKNGDKVFMQFAGKWDVVSKDGEFVEAPFEAKGDLLGGTGKFQGISGPVLHKGKVTPSEGGVYRIEFSF